MTIELGTKERLNTCLDILDSTELGLSMVWLWTWSIIKSFMEDEQYKFNLSEDEVWENLFLAVSNGAEFTLEYGADQAFEAIQSWLIHNDIMTDLMFEEE